MELPKVEVIGAQAAQAVVEEAQRAVAGAVVGLGGEEDLLAALAEGGAVVIDAAGVGGGRVAIGHPLIEPLA